MVPFSGGVTHLRGCHGLSKNRVCCSGHSQWLIGYSGFTTLKNQFIGVARVIYIPWFGFLNKSQIGHLLGQKVPIFEMSKNSEIF